MSDTPSSSTDIDAIYGELRANRGREKVDDANVSALIERAHRDGDQQLELLLREWKSPCGEGAGTLPEKLPPP